MIKLKKYWWIGIIIVSMPVIINLCYYIPSIDKIFEEPKAWTSFWGTYISTIISSLIAFYVLHEQLKQNHKENEDNRIANNIENQKNRGLEKRLFEYTNNHNKIEMMKKDLIDFQISFNLLALSSILANIKAGKYLQNDIDILSSLIRDIDEKQFRIDISMSKIPQSKELDHFNNIFNSLYNEYGLLLADLLFFIDLLRNLPTDKDSIFQYVKMHVENSCNTENQYIQILSNDGICLTPTISSIIKERGDYTDIEEHRLIILENRYKLASEIISSLKEKLKAIIVNLVNIEEDRIEKLLDNKE